MARARGTIGPEEEQVIRNDERAKVLAEIATAASGAEQPKLTLADVAQMAPQEVAARLDEVSALQGDPAAWQEYAASQAGGDDS
jgi:hypothetical protein